MYRNTLETFQIKEYEASRLSAPKGMNRIIYERKRMFIDRSQAWKYVEDQK